MYFYFILEFILTDYFGVAFVQGFFTLADDGRNIPVLPIAPAIRHHYGMSSRSEVNGNPLAIVHLYLSGMVVTGTPPRVIYENFRSYFDPQDLLFLEMDFDCGTDGKAVAHQRRMAEVAEMLRERGIGRIFLFISTHSDQTRGDLFIGRDGQPGTEFSAKVEAVCVSSLWSFSTNATSCTPQFFRAVVPEPFGDLLHNSVIVLLTCGWVFKFKESFQGLQVALRG